MPNLTRGIMYDTSNPAGLSLPRGAAAVAGYIGGDTPHIWTRTQWQQFGRLPKLPIWVRSNVPNNIRSAPLATADAFAALTRLYRLGVPRGSRLGLDLETAVDPVYVNRFGDIMEWAGFYPWVYGSAGFVFKNPALRGYFPAEYKGFPFMYNHSDVRGTQYADAEQLHINWDATLVKPFQLTRMWR